MLFDLDANSTDEPTLHSNEPTPCSTDAAPRASIADDSGTQVGEPADPLRDTVCITVEALELRLGPYLLKEELARTSFHTVYRAVRPESPEESVAVKVYWNGTRSSSMPERLRREGLFLQGLDHENVVKSHGYGAEFDLLYLVLEYVPGASLARLVHDRGPLDAKWACELVSQAAAGLDHVHASGMVHRDVKPANLILTPDGVVKVIDFGIALGDDEDGSLTRDCEERLLGTVDYLSPEQADSSHDVDGRADVYSLGCTLFYLMTGRPPFVGGSMATRLMQHRDLTPPSLATFRPDAPAALVDLCREMLDKNPTTRIPSMRDVFARLEAILDD